MPSSGIEERGLSSAFRGNSDVFNGSQHAGSQHAHATVIPAEE
jgi:hypothetical protein